ncbi:uncharacterized protein V6R79_018221 [Siganus canaliculatus]
MRPGALIHQRHTAESRVLLLVVLFGGSLSRPAKNVPHPPANSGSAGSVWENPSPGFAAPIAYASASDSFSAGPLNQPAGPSYFKASPGYSSYDSSSVRPGSSHEVLTGPPGPPGTRPTARRFDPEDEGPAFAPAQFSPILPAPGPFPPQFQAGELSNFEKTYEHGNTERETEEQGFQPPPPFIAAMSGPGYTSELLPSGPSRSLSFWPWYPKPYDYRFLTGQYPPGTYTHASSNLEHGADHWQDTHYIRDYLPPYLGPEPEEAPAADFGVSQNVQQTGQPATQGTGGSSYDQSGPPTGPKQAYGRPRLLSSYYPTSLNQGHHKPAVDSRKVGY